jgi:hypothetical protein
MINIRIVETSAVIVFYNNIELSLIHSLGTMFLYLSVQVNMIKGDGSVIHFNNPKVQASLTANTFAITGHAETKRKYFYVCPVYCVFMLVTLVRLDHDRH